jgi:hypothetical protein
VNRRDFEVAFIGLDPAFELHRPAGALDMAGIYRGHDGYRLDPLEVVDLGERRGLLVRQDDFHDRDEAFAAAGLDS